MVSRTSTSLAPAYLFQKNNRESFIPRRVALRSRRFISDLTPYSVLSLRFGVIEGMENHHWSGTASATPAYLFPALALIGESSFVFP